MNKIDLILANLDKVKSTGKHKWVACCPAHADRSPSLAIKEVGDRILIHCFSGCLAAEVMGAIGMTMSDLFNDPLTEADGARYRHKHLVDDYRSLTTVVALYQQEMDNNKLDEDGKRRFRDYLAEKMDVTSHINDLERKYGL